MAEEKSGGFVKWKPTPEGRPFEGFASNEELLDAARRLEAYLAKLQEWDRKHKRQLKIPPGSVN